MIAAKLRVHAIGAHLAARLGAAASLPGRPHSVFEHAINFTAPDGTLLALHGPWLLAAPFAIALPTWDQDLSAGDLILDLEGAQRVDLAIRPAADGHDAARDLLDEALARSASTPLAPGLNAAAGRAARSALSLAIRRRDPGGFLEAARGLVGLGEGLTPAGDDYLVGALAGLHRLGDGWPVGDAPLRDAVIAHACRTTPTVSAAFLLYAVKGQFSEPLRDLAMAGSAAATREAAAALARMGATSGVDTLAGMREALAALAAARE
jgi:hypothetical protein